MSNNDSDHPLTDNGRKTLDAFVKEYESQLLTMAKKLEEVDNDGSNPTEITQAHVEQAKWALRRRQRRRHRYTLAMKLTRLGEIVMSALVGVGGSIYFGHQSQDTLLSMQNLGMVIAVVGLVGVATTVYFDTGGSNQDL